MPIAQEGPLYDEKGAGQCPAPSRAQNDLLYDYFSKMHFRSKMLFRPALSASYQRGLASLGSFGGNSEGVSGIWTRRGEGRRFAPAGFALLNAKSLISSCIGEQRQDAVGGWLRLPN
jgi:hypothetical protein